MSTTLPPVPEGYGNALDLVELARVTALHRRALEAYYTNSKTELLVATPFDPTDKRKLAGILAAHAVLSEGTAS